MVNLIIWWFGGTGKSLHNFKGLHTEDRLRNNELKESSKILSSRFLLVGNLIYVIPGYDLKSWTEIQ